MTIYEIKQRTKKTSPYFFSSDTMRFFGQTLKDFKVSKQADGRYKITAKSKAYSPVLPVHMTIRYFNPINDRLENE
tara:strand:+ start:326 stop:553 length:228 start_codon:yes stop_codon:yes gene_type:complete